MYKFKSFTYIVIRPNWFQENLKFEYDDLLDWIQEMGLDVGTFENELWHCIEKQPNRNFQDKFSVSGVAFQVTSRSSRPIHMSESYRQRITVRLI